MTLHKLIRPFNAKKTYPEQNINNDHFTMQWSGKLGQRSKMYPTLMNTYENDKMTELFRKV